MTQEQHFYAIVRAIVDFKELKQEVGTTIIERFFMQEIFNKLDLIVQKNILENIQKTEPTQEFSREQIVDRVPLPSIPTQEEMDLDDFDQMIRSLPRR